MLELPAKIWSIWACGCRCCLCGEVLSPPPAAAAPAEVPAAAAAAACPDPDHNPETQPATELAAPELEPRLPNTLFMKAFASLSRPSSLVRRRGSPKCFFAGGGAGLGGGEGQQRRASAGRELGLEQAPVCNDSANGPHVDDGILLLAPAAPHAHHVVLTHLRHQRAAERERLQSGPPLPASRW